MGFSASVSIVRPGVVRARKILAPGMSWVIAAVFALADLARGSLASLLAFLSGWWTRGTSLAAQLDARHDTGRQDTLLTWAARHGQAEAVRLLLEGG